MKGQFLANSEGNRILSPRPSPNLGLKATSVLEKTKEAAPAKVEQKNPHVGNNTEPNHNSTPANK